MALSQNRRLRRKLLASGNKSAASDAFEASARLGSDDAAFAAAVVLLNSGQADPARSLELLRFASNQGSSEAALILGKILWSTQGSQQEGVRLLWSAAESGDPEALYVLGLACFRGQGIEKNLAASRELHLAAATCGLPDARFELSLLLEQGIGGPCDRRGAARWEARAAEAGHPRACLNRGARLGNRKRPDWTEVARWYARAAAAGNTEAATRLRKMASMESISDALDSPHAELADASLPTTANDARSEADAPTRSATTISTESPRPNRDDVAPAPRSDAGTPLGIANRDGQSLQGTKDADKPTRKRRNARFSTLLAFKNDRAQKP